MAEEDLSCSTEARDGERDNSVLNNNNSDMNEDDSNTGGEWSATGYESSDSSAVLRCDRCDFETSCKDELISHAASCQASGVLLCDRCDYETVCRDSLNNHTATCQGDGRKLFECDICFVKFSSGANMRRHRLRHTGIKPFECRVCHKRFFRKDHLAEHTSTHTKQLPHTCPVCSRGFQRHIAMRAHFQNEHVGKPDPVTKVCPLCQFTAPSMKSLRIHFFTRHGIDLDKGSIAIEDYTRRLENGSPPMHFLTPHVEISMAETSSNPLLPLISNSKSQGESSGEGSGGEANEETPHNQPSAILQSLTSPTVDSILSQRSLALRERCSTPLARERSSTPLASRERSSTPLSSRERSNTPTQALTPHVSLIPIKQEPVAPSQQNNHQNNPPTSLIKVSPLKSLLREEPRGVVDQAHDWTRPTRLNCQYCCISFPDKTLYFLHKGCHSTDTNPWKCNICGEQTSNVYDFNSHLLSKSHH